MCPVHLDREKTTCNLLQTPISGLMTEQEDGFQYTWTSVN